MGRKSLLTKIKETIKVPNNRDKTWMLAYDYPQGPASPRFYKLLSEYMTTLGKTGAYVERIQSSIILTNDLHGFITMTRLAQHYDAKVYTCKVTEQPPDQIQLLNTKLLILPHERADVYWITARHNTDKTRKHIPGETEKLLETLYGLRYGLQQTIDNITTTLHDEIKATANQQPTYTQPHTLTGNQVWVVLGALRKHLTQKRDAHTETAYRILWRLNNKETPPEPTKENIAALLSEQPVEVWKQQHQK